MKHKWMPCIGLWMFLSLASACAASDWPQLQFGPRRLGHSPDAPLPTFQEIWCLRLQETAERVNSWAQPVVYQGHVLFGTTLGTVYAVDVNTGRITWKHETGGPITMSVAGGADKVFYCNTFGEVGALDIGDGSPSWKVSLGSPGFSVAPLLAEQGVFLGSRGGIFHGLNAADGKILWEFDCGEPILMSAAYNEGRVYFADEGLKAFALDAKTGAKIWEAGPFWGNTFAWTYPVVYGGKVVFHALPLGKKITPVYYPEAEYLDKEVEGYIRERISDPEVLARQQADLTGWIEKNPYWQDYYVLDEKTGEQPYKAGIYYCCQNAGPAMLPVLGGDGNLYVNYNPYFFSHRLSGPVCLARFDIDTGRVTALLTEFLAPDGVFRPKDMDRLWECVQFVLDTEGNPQFARNPKTGEFILDADGRKKPQDFVGYTNDESTYITGGGNCLYDFHGHGDAAVLDLATREVLAWGPWGRNGVGAQNNFGGVISGDKVFAMHSHGIVILRAFQGGWTGDGAWYDRRD